MRSVEELTDPQTIRLAAILLEKENQRLHQRIKQLVEQLSALKKQNGGEQLKLELDRLQEQMARLEHQLYGPPGDKRPAPAPGPETPPAPAKPKRPGHGPRPQPQLPRVDVGHELEPHERVCELCGKTQQCWDGQSEDSEEITVVKRRFEVHVNKRQKYRCENGCAPLTAPGPLKLTAKGRYSVEFAVQVAVDKYLDHLPLERQVRIMARQGLETDSQTLWDQLWALSQHLVPTYEQLRKELWSRSLLHGDETRWPMLGGAQGRKLWYVWTLAAPDAVYHHILPSRGQDSAAIILQGYTGRLLVDGYEVYQALSRKQGRLVLLFCWAHVRRKFVEALPFEPACQKVLELIGQLYQIERELPAVPLLSGPEQQEVLSHRRQVRQQRSAPVLDQIKDWALQQRGLPQSSFRKAIDYMLSLWTGLSHFVQDPLAPLDNNLVERQMRDVVLGRKNHYGSKSLRGTQVAALFYSLLETAKLRGVEPAAYLLEAAQAAIQKPGTVWLPRAGP